MQVSLATLAGIRIESERAHQEVIRLNAILTAHNGAQDVEQISGGALGLPECGFLRSYHNYYPSQQGRA